MRVERSVGEFFPPIGICQLRIPAQRNYIYINGKKKKLKHKNQISLTPSSLVIPSLFGAAFLFSVQTSPPVRLRCSKMTVL